MMWTLLVLYQDHLAHEPTQPRKQYWKPTKKTPKSQSDGFGWWV